MIVADASAVVGSLTVVGEPGRSLRERLRRDDIHAPHLLDVEVASAVRRLIAAGHLERAAADQAIGRLRRWPLNRHSHVPLLPRIHALRASVSSYDATYIALAELLRAPLVTSDGRLARSSGHRAVIEHHPL